MQPCHNMKDEGYHDSCAVSAVCSITGLPFKQVADEMMKLADKKETSGGFTIAEVDKTLQHFGFPCESEASDYLEYLLGISGWPRSFRKTVEGIGRGKAVIDVIMVPGVPDTCHSIAVENGMLADIVVSPEPVTVDEWLKLYHGHSEKFASWGDPDVVALTHLTQNPIPKEGIKDGVPENPTA